MLSLALTVSAHAQFVISPTFAFNYSATYTDTDFWLSGTINNQFIGTVNAVTVSVPDAVLRDGSNLIFTGTVNTSQFKVGDRVTGDGIPDGTIITAINNAGLLTVSAPVTASGNAALTVTGIGAYQRGSHPEVQGMFTAVEGSDVVTISIDATHYLVPGLTIINSREPGVFTGGATVTAINSANSITVSQTAGKSGGSYAFFTNAPNGGYWNISVDNTPYTVNGDTFVYQNADNSHFRLGANSNFNWTLAPASGTFSFIVDMGAVGDGLIFELGTANNFSTPKLDFQDGAAVFNITPSTASMMTSAAVGLDRLSLNVSATNLSALTKDGVGSLMVDNANAAHRVTMAEDSTVTIKNGQIVVASAGIAWDQARLSGATHYDLTAYGAVLQLNASSFNTASAESNLIERDASINLWSGVFNAYGASAEASQQVGDVTLKAGRNIIGTAGANNTVFTLTMNQLLRDGDATVNFLFGNANSPIIVSDATNAAALESQLVGGILPWASGQLQAAAINGWQYTANLANMWVDTRFGGDTFVTVSGGTIRPLTDSEYYTVATGGTINTAGVTDNVYTNAGGQFYVTASSTINSLRMNNWNFNVNFQNNATLTVTSGALLFTNGGNQILTGSGTLNTGARPLIVQGNAGSSAINLPYVNTVADNTQAGLIVAMKSSANLTLGAANAYTGYTLVQSGSLTVSHSNALNANAALLLDQTGGVTVSGNIKAGVTELRGDGKVDFSNNANQLNIGSVAPYTGNNVITVGDAGVLAPGGVATPDGIGTLTLGAGVTAVNFLADSVFAVDLAGNGLSDTLAFTNSAATLSFAAGATVALHFLDNYTPADGDSWLFATGFDFTASAALSDLTKLTISGLDADYDYLLDFTTSGLQLTLTTIPEPTSATLLLLGGALLALTLRRRQRL
ncbi:MAG: PEP-CTERM sorting domain-containing protein [Verrucomicrobiales bacterium]|nr:PEP-CTERM sorting domain-containing protein [Verrucomicrobiales bacterium]